MACQRHYLPISDETNNPKNYRDITFLTTMYKILTSILTEYTYSLLVDSGLFPDQQKVCKHGSNGCKDQLLINKMILENCHNRKTNLQSHGLTTKRPLIVYLIHGSKNVLKLSRHHLSQLSLSQHAYVENNISFKHWGKHIKCRGYQYHIFQGILFLLVCFVLV